MEAFALFVKETECGKMSGVIVWRDGGEEERSDCVEGWWRGGEE